MKTLKRLLCLAACLVLCAALFVPALADVGDPYEYTIRIYAGNQGYIEGYGPVRTYTLPAGYRFSATDFDINSVKATEPDKYYVRAGLRESGKDNNTLQPVSFEVTKDMDYVVAYGIKGETITLTVRYRDIASGEDLADATYYYGNVNDKPMVSYLYINDYELAPSVTIDGTTRRQGYTITGTITEDTEWTFWYNPITEPETTVVETVVTTTGDTTTGTTAGTAPGGEAGAAPAAENPNPAPEQNAPAPAEPEEIIDMDTPLANFPGSDATPAPEDTAAPTTAPTATPGPGVTTGRKGMGPGAITAVSVAGAGGIGGVVWFLLSRRKRKVNEK